MAAIPLLLPFLLNAPTEIMQFVSLIASFRQHGISAADITAQVALLEAAIGPLDADALATLAQIPDVPKGA